MIGGILVEKDAETIRGELDTQIINIKQTLDLVQKSLKTQEAVMKEFEKTFSKVLVPQKSKQTQESNVSSGKGGVLA